jgi:hypothetical protein
LSVVVQNSESRKKAPAIQALKPRRARRLARRLAKVRCAQTLRVSSRLARLACLNGCDLSVAPALAVLALFLGFVAYCLNLSRSFRRKRAQKFKGEADISRAPIGARTAATTRKNFVLFCGNLPGTGLNREVREHSRRSDALKPFACLRVLRGLPAFGSPAVSAGFLGSWLTLVSSWNVWD